MPRQENPGLSCQSQQVDFEFRRKIRALSVCGPFPLLASASTLQAWQVSRLFSLRLFEWGRLWTFI